MATRRKQKRFSAKSFTNEQRKAYKQGVLDKLKEGVSKLLGSDAWKAHLKTQTAFYKYSFRNTVLIHQQMPEATYVAAYGKWKDLGRQVTKEAKGKGLRIFCPIPFTKRGTDEEGNETTSAGIRFGITSVFDISQTKGDPLPLRGPLQDVKGDGAPLLANLLAFAEQRGIPVERIDEAKALYYGQSHKIKLGRYSSSAMEAMALAHELGHAFFRHGGADCKLSSPRKELEAQSVAFVVCEHFGHDASAFTFEYIGGWKGESAAEAFIESGTRIQKAAKEIIEYIEGANKPKKQKKTPAGKKKAA